MQGPGERPIYVFEGFRLDAQRRVLSDVDGEPVSLAPKALDTLLYLVERSGELIDKRELLDAIWPNLIVEENNLKQCISALRRVLGEAPTDHKFIVTERGRGYRFVASVETWESAANLDHSRIARNKTAGRLGYAAFAVSVLVLAALAVNRFVMDSSDSSISSKQQSVAVLAFIDLSEEGRYAWFADSVREEILGLLDQLPGLRVVSRASAFTGSGETLAELAERLDINYVLDGTVRREQGRFAVTVRLNDARANTQIWFEEYEGTLNERFTIPETIAAEIAEPLRITLRGPAPAVEYELSRETYVLYDEAAHTIRNLIGDNFGRAEDLLLEVIERAPEFLPAYLSLSHLYRQLPNAGLLSWSEADRLADEIFEAAAARFPDSPEILSPRAWERFTDDDLEGAARDYERLRSASPDDLSNIGVVPFLVNLRRPEKAVEVGEDIVDRRPLCGLCYANLAHAYLAAGRYDRAMDTHSRALTLNLVSSRSNNNLRSAYAASLLLAGDPEAALAEIKALTVNSVEWFVFTWSAMAYHELGQRERFEAELRKLHELAPGHEHLLRAAVHSYTGDFDSAFEALDAALGSRKSMRGDIVLFTSAGPFDLAPLSALRDDPRWQDFAVRAGISADEERRRRIDFDVTLPE